MTEAVAEVIAADAAGRRGEWVAAVVEAIRARNTDGALVSEQELQETLQASWQQMLIEQAGEGSAEAMPELVALLPDVLVACPDLQTTEGPDGETFYFLLSLMSRTYAEIQARKTAPHLLIATEVRRNSKEYPRAIPIDIFEYPPFGLTVEQVQEALKFLSENTDFADITYTTSSVGTVYLFSTDYLDRNYGEFMAEHADVIRATSP